MTQQNIPLTNGASYVFPDSNVVLEGKPLAELPWDQLGVASPIVLVFVPQVLKEVDSKKHDGRIGKRAREFNRLLVQVTAQDGCMLLPNQDREVYLAIGRPTRIDWGHYGDEDPDDGDTRVVLEVLNLPDIPVQKAIFVSNDVKPIWIARRFGLKVHHAGDDWRRAIEPSPHDKEVQRLKQRVAELETSQPKLELDIAADLRGFKRFVVHPLSPEAGDEVMRELRARHPPPSPRSRTYFEFQSQLLGHEEGIVTADAYQEFEDKLPIFVECLPSYLEQEHGQFPFAITVKNIGPLRAQNLILKVACSSGWMSGRPVLMPTRGPSPKKTRRSSTADWLSRHALVHRPSRHEMHLAEEPSRSRFMEVQCEDFPSGRSWTFEGYACIDPRSSEPFSISAQITAANLHGTIHSDKRPDYEKAEAAASDLVDLKTLHPRIEAQSRPEIKRRFENQRYGDVDLFRSDDDD